MSVLLKPKATSLLSTYPSVFIWNTKVCMMVWCAINLILSNYNFILLHSSAFNCPLLKSSLCLIKVRCMLLHVRWYWMCLHRILRVVASGKRAVNFVIPVNPAHEKEFLILSLTCTGLRRVEGSSRVASVSWAAALAPPARCVVLAVITNTSAGATCGAPHSLGEVTALRMAVTFTL